MKASWVIYTYPYGFQSVAPTSADYDFPLGYIWIINSLGVAYSLSSVSDTNRATWILKQPDIIYNYGTGFQVNIIGDASLINVTTSTPPTIVIPDGVVISAPGVGERLIREIYLDEHKKLVAKYDEEPIG